MKSIITIFTPTYNRGKLLETLWKSLEVQDNYDFEWLIVDDGSKDNTKEIIEKLKKRSHFAIRYYYQENQGKHIAINMGAKLAQGEWFFIVDSDDYLTESAVRKIWEQLGPIKDNKQYAGVAGLKGKEDGTAWMSWYGKEKPHDLQIDLNREEGYIDATSIDYRYKYKIAGDRAEVIRTNLVRQYPFPKFEGEHFLSEAALWLRVAQKGYLFRWFPEVVYVADYLEDGLSQNSKNLHKKNCQGSCYIEKIFLNCRGIPLKERIKSTINYYRYGFYCGKKFLTLFKEKKS